MRRLVFSFVFFLVTSAAYASSSIAAKRIDYIRGAVFSLAQQQEFVNALAWEKGGVTIDYVIQYLDEFYPDVFSIYKTRGRSTQFYSDTGLRIVVGRSLEKAMAARGDVFSMRVQQGSKRTRKYFVGEKPDIDAIVKSIGVEKSTEEIVDAIILQHPDVYTLYVQASADKNDRGLRVAVGKARAQLHLQQQQQRGGK